MAHCAADNADPTSDGACDSRWSLLRLSPNASEETPSESEAVEADDGGVQVRDPRSAPCRGDCDTKREDAGEDGVADRAWLRDAVASTLRLSLIHI
eukprot:10115676-Alexandrium_andersonii.AAC.1